MPLDNRSYFFEQSVHNDDHVRSALPDQSKHQKQIYLTKEDILGPSTTKKILNSFRKSKKSKQIYSQQKNSSQSSFGYASSSSDDYTDTSDPDDFAISSTESLLLTEKNTKSNARSKHSNASITHSKRSTSSISEKKRSNTFVSQPKTLDTSKPSKHSSRHGSSIKSNRCKSTIDANYRTIGYPLDSSTTFPFPPSLKSGITPIQPKDEVASTNNLRIRFSSKGTFCNRIPYTNSSKTSSLSTIKLEDSPNRLRESKSHQLFDSPHSSSAGLGIVPGVLKQQTSTPALKTKKSVTFMDFNKYQTPFSIESNDSYPVRSQPKQPASLLKYSQSGTQYPNKDPLLAKPFNDVYQQTVPAAYSSRPPKQKSKPRTRRSLAKNIPTEPLANELEYPLNASVPQTFNTADQNQHSLENTKYRNLLVIGFLVLFSYSYLLQFFRSWLQNLTPFIILMIVFAAALGPLFNNQLEGDQQQEFNISRHNDPNIQNQPANFHFQRIRDKK